MLTPVPEHEKVSILLVDDHPENLLALEALLSNLGQNLVRAESGIEALRLLLHHEFALILLDVDMPAINGFETAELIRQRDRSRHTPIMFLTAVNKAEQHVFKGYQIGAVDYLTKPFVPEVLRSKVIAFVELHKKTEEVKRQTKLLQQMNVELESEKNFISTVLDTADSIIVVLDADQKIVRASRAFERTLGYSLEEVQGRRLSAFFVSAGPWSELDQAENYWSAKDGSSRLIGVVKDFPWRPKWVRRTLVRHHGNDITERKRTGRTAHAVNPAEAARQEAEAQNAARRSRRSQYHARVDARLREDPNQYFRSRHSYVRRLVLRLPGARRKEISSALIAHSDPEKEFLRSRSKSGRGTRAHTSCVRVFQTGTPELLSYLSDDELRRR
jgi:PAS domain S-box-containing protein